MNFIKEYKKISSEYNANYEKIPTYAPVFYIETEKLHKEVEGKYQELREIIKASYFKEICIPTIERGKEEVQLKKREWTKKTREVTKFLYDNTYEKDSSIYDYYLTIVVSAQKQAWNFALEKVGISTRSSICTTEEWGDAISSIAQDNAKNNF